MENDQTVSALAIGQKIPFIFTMASLILGVSIAIVFGINEDIIKNKIKGDLKKNPIYLSMENPVDKKKYYAKEKSKNWRYYQRFHFHSTGIGAISLGALLLLAFLQAPLWQKTLSSYFIAIGGGLYPFVWLFAGIYGPLIGRSQAKEKFAIFGYMGGIYLVGLIFLLFCLCRYPLCLNSKKD